MRDDTFAFRLRQARTAAQMTPATLAEQVGVGRQMISEWESGRTRPSAYAVRICAKHLGVDATWLAGRKREITTVREVIERG